VARYGPGVRHLRSILYALVLAPAVWILCGVGFDQDLTGRARDNGGIESLSGVLLLLLAGAGYAILLFAPISPLGPLLAGLTFAGVGAWARIAPSSYAGLWPGNVASDGFDLSTPGYGLAVLLAVPLLVVALSARRWAGYEPPQIVLIGTIGRARVAGTPMAAERTTVIPQQRQESGFGGSSDATQVVGQLRPADHGDGDGDEKTTVMRLGSAPASPAPARRGDAPTEDVAASEQATETIAPTEPATEAVPVAVPEPATEAIAVPASTSTSTSASASASASEETTRDVIVGEGSGEETTRLVLAAAQPADDGDEKTQLLTLPKPAAHDEQTQMIRTGTVEPPGDRTQLLTFRAAGETTQPTAPAPSIVAAERPDPAEDPTTRLNLPPRTPGEATTRPNRDRPAMTATNLERPADEAADDTRPLTLPVPRPPADEDTTRHL
jgi:hypothetical protein